MYCVDKMSGTPVRDDYGGWAKYLTKCSVKIKPGFVGVFFVFFLGGRGLNVKS